MFESQVHAELPVMSGPAVIILGPAANDFQRVRPLLPFQRFALKCPQVPLRFHNVRRVFVNMLRSDRCDFRRAKSSLAKIPLGHRRFPRIDSLNHQIVEAISRRGELHGRQKSHELRNHRFSREFPRPNTKISPVCHGKGIIQAAQRHSHSWLPSVASVKASCQQLALGLKRSF